jgi:methylenetetrahydrofolate reductase (NADPH)
MTTKDDVDSRQTRKAMSDVFKNLGYEVLPFKGTADNVLANVPKDIRLTVTASPPKGIGATIDLAVALAGHGYRVAPHLSARMIADERQLADIVGQLDKAGIDDVFVVGGDANDPGDFPDALSLLDGLHKVGANFTDVGIGGYPEGHASISDSNLQIALKAKAPSATNVVTQICFNARTTIQWATELHQNGIDLPIRVGMPGAVSRQKLIRISSGIGLGESAKFLKKQQSMFWRFFLPGGYSPDKLIAGLRSSLRSTDSNIAGFHIFTFNELEKTEIWRRHMLHRSSNNGYVDDARI